MKNRYFLLLLIIVFPFASGKGYTGADTTFKKVTRPARSMEFQIGDFQEYFKDGVMYMRQDDAEKGINLLSTGINHLYQEKKVDRVLPAQVLEFFDLIRNVNNGSLTKEEKLLMEAILKASFSDKKPADKKFNAFIRQLPNTMFSRRLKVLLLTDTDPGKSNKELDKLLKDYPSLVSGNMRKAEILYDEGKYNESIIYTHKVISLSPQYAYAYVLRGKSYEELNEQEKAIADYSEAIRLFPEYYEAYYNRSNVLLDLDKYREAVEGYKKISAVYQSYKWCNYNLCRGYKGLGMADSAIYYVNNHINQYPKDGDGYNLKGDVYYETDDYPLAIEFYTQAIQLNPDKAGYYEDRGDANYYSNLTDAALTDFKRSIELYKNQPYIYDRIGDCYHRKKEYEKAITYHKLTLKLDPNYKYAYVGLNLNYVKLGKLEPAIEACKKAIDIDSTYATALGNLGWTYYCKGNFDDCIKFSYKTLIYKKDATYAMFNIALATLRKGEFEKAKKLYGDFIEQCKQNNYEIEDGATEDLTDLIKKNILVKESKFILKNIFGREP